MRGSLALGILGMLLLAGCSGGGSDDGPKEDFKDLELQASDTKGLIRGVVVDDAIRPIANARVDLRGATTASTTSSEEGLFGFDQLDPGTYFLQVSRLGYRTTQVSAEVVAGVAEPPVTRVLLATDLGFVPPYYEQYIFEGFMECSSGGAAPGVGYAYLNACSSSPEAFPNDKTEWQQVLGGYPEWVQSEMIWESTQSVSQSLSLNFHYPDSGEQDGEKDLSVEGESPLTNTMDNATAKEYIEGVDFEEGGNLTLRIRVFTRATGGTGPAVTFQQRFTVYTTVFYGYLPPTGWTLRETGEVPPPPS
ncbi:MAG TPA: carboxypeptidase-like regulatory domain-containing protein [Candidatus Thermoplasmatota archaeon]|nr:carboxypeptidase-like regulatory domain-containing protein [Candidatus Thermoplasmatota archaeon]